jgi:hypothetical protein
MQNARRYKTYLGILVISGLCTTFPKTAQAQESEKSGEYWNFKTTLNPYRLPPPPIGFTPRREDLNGDGKPDAIFSMTHSGVPVLWLDENGNMEWDDLEGDTANDCLLIDRNKDGVYGGQGDLIIKWVDNDGDGKADMQLVVDYPDVRTDDVWPNGHYMWVIDTDKDDIFNYINWNRFTINAWDHSGICDFMLDYSGKSAFLKIHASTYHMNDLRLNWETPFLFYDFDDDGLSEMAIRVLDSPDRKANPDKGANHPDNMQLNGKADWISISVDLDNDNRPGNEFDFDFTLNFRGEGFDYTDQVHKINNMRGLPEADKFFIDPRFRKLNELIYPDHDSVFDLIFKRGKWQQVYFVFDEDDDCARWERVELYDPLDPFLIGARQGGIDNNTQSDASGDRGEWDMDNSGGGKLYIGRFDGRLHLYGAEWGCWRIDQNAGAYQGFDRKFSGRDPEVFGTVRYSDTDDNGFIDCIEYDLDGDKVFETVVKLKELGIDDHCELIDVSGFTCDHYLTMFRGLADNMWNNALKAEKYARRFGLNTAWYAKLKQTASLRQKYDNGYWLQFYLYRDLENLFLRKKDGRMLVELAKAYYSGNWDSLIK